MLTTPDMILQDERKVYMEPRMKEQQRIKDEIVNYEDVSNDYVSYIRCMILLFLVVQNNWLMLSSILFFLYIHTNIGGRTS